MGAHCSYSLLKYGQFDEEGNAKRYKLNIQTPFIKAMKTTIDGIVGAVDLLPENGNEKISELLGSIVRSLKRIFIKHGAAFPVLIYLSSDSNLVGQIHVIPCDPSIINLRKLVVKATSEMISFALKLIYFSYLH